MKAEKLNGRRGIGLLTGLLVTVLCLPGATVCAAASEAVSADAVSESTGQKTYQQYLSEQGDAANGTQIILLRGADFQPDQSAGAALSQDEAGGITAVTAGEGSRVTWEFAVESPGLYQITIRYRPEDGKGTDMVRDLYVNGKIPYNDLQSLTFSRIYADADSSWKTDDYGNQIKPDQKEIREYTNKVVTGSTYNAGTPVRVYLARGSNTVTLTAQKEPMSISEIRFSPPATLPTYAQVSSGYSAYADLPVETMRVEAERVYRRSSTTLYPLSDRSSPLTQPNSLSNLVLNVVGGTNWSKAGQWIEWEIPVEKEGLYRVSLRGKQNISSDTVSYRQLTINGEVPFVEAANIPFRYAGGWQTFTLGENNPWLFHLMPGTYVFRLEAVTGPIGSVLEETVECTAQMNKAYRLIKMITGPYPDSNRDYELESKVPQALDILREERQRLGELKKKTVEVSGQKGQGYARFEKLEMQLNSFLYDPNTIPARMDAFQTNISDLSSWVLSSQQQPLLLDALVLTGADGELPAGDAGFFRQAAYEAQSFFQSFFNDYTRISSSSEGTRSVKLWLGSVSGEIGSGRDQAQILKALVDSSFSPRQGIAVDIQLVDMSTLLPAVSAGTGPDVAIGNARDMPMNYAYRGALLDLTQFDGFGEAAARFDNETLTPFRYGDKVFALPDTYVFYMMFYRTDILQELGMEPPKTWNDVYTLLPQLQNQYMDIGLPNISDNVTDLFYTLLFQRGGSVYSGDMSGALLDSGKSIAAFETWAGFYTKYNVSQKINHLTRFRTGETPIVFMPYTFYNSIEAGAPEIDGLWDFAPMPGTLREDGSVDCTAYATSTGSVIFSNADDPQAAWEFLDWWTSEETQYQYGMDIENLQGASGRWATANRAAMERLPWTNANLQAIREQEASTQGLAEVPGGYITGRYLSTAIRLVVNNGVVARAALLDYNKLINDEIEIKRQEFGLTHED